MLERGAVMNKKFLWIGSLFIVLFLAGCGVKNVGANTDVTIVNEQQHNVKEKVPVKSSHDSKILIAYFSRAGNVANPDNIEIDAATSASINFDNENYIGNTEYLAHWIEEFTGGDLFLIQTTTPYSLDYNETVNRGKQENSESSRPELISRVENIDNYDTIFLGFPNWWYDMPMAVYSFLEEYDLSGKTIIPFCTSGGSQFSNTISEIETLQPNGKVIKDGLAIRDNDAPNGKNTVIKWLQELGFSQANNTADEISTDASFQNDADSEKIEKEQNDENKDTIGLNITIGENAFSAVMYDNETTRALIDKLPITIDMTEMNGNEKYCFLTDSFPVNSKPIKQIHTGDFMLYGNNCLVLFYQDFSSSYSYTRLGYIEDITGFAETVGEGNIEAVFELK